MATNFEAGSFNGRSNAEGRPKPRPVVHVPSKAACKDDIDATMDRICREIMERNRKMPRERGR